MMAPSAEALLRTWEAGARESRPAQALRLLALARPDVPVDELARWPLGRRDAALLSLREALFGPQVECVANCPRCGERLELTFALSDIRAPTEELTDPLTVAVDGYQVAFRLPTSLDLLTVAANGGTAPVRQSLLARCVLSAARSERTVEVETLPEPVVDEVVAQMALADPQADIELSLSCPACDHRWQAPFDIVSFLWVELDAWADRLLWEVHTLASAYGWSEREILRVGVHRRQQYLERVLA